ncbi:PID-CTERM protein-sorting domain-containing protein [Segetibacter koreensis]|uniref:PID-CTERM protein-sorting domain-containing protein n=1 Tax=Segetibacter koreensis TaxID=398037 RepID=UPI0003688640|nr:hypothetical protein [Segetibacter koreensis]
MKKVIKKLKLALVIGMITIPTILIAQGGTPTDPGDGNNDTNDADVPFDGGVSLLVAAGIGYGIKKVYDKKKQEKDPQVSEK